MYETSPLVRFVAHVVGHHGHLVLLGDAGGDGVVAARVGDDEARPALRELPQDDVRLVVADVGDGLELRADRGGGGLGARCSPAGSSRSRSASQATRRRPSSPSQRGALRSRTRCRLRRVRRPRLRRRLALQVDASASRDSPSSGEPSRFRRVERCLLLAGPSARVALQTVNKAWTAVYPNPSGE